MAKKAAPKSPPRVRGTDPRSDRAPGTEAFTLDYAALFECLPVATFIVDREGHIESANAAAQGLFDYSAAELRGLAGEHLVAPTARAQAAAWRQRLFTDRVSAARLIPLELTGLRKDGETFPIEVAATRIGPDSDPRLVCCVRDVARRKKAENQLHRYHEDLRRLNARIVAAQEETARGIARELHDVTSQKLAVLGMRLAALDQVLAGQPSQRTVANECRALAAEITGEVTHLARQTHPAIVDDLGLAAALRAECQSMEQHYGIPVEFSESGGSQQLPGAVALGLYRIAQEAIRNVRHASAKAIKVHLSADTQTAVLRIDDEGDGFDLKEIAGRRGLGLISMRERATVLGGTLTVKSEIGTGTTVLARIPLPSADTP